MTRKRSGLFAGGRPHYDVDGDGDNLVEDAHLRVAEICALHQCSLIPLIVSNNAATSKPGCRWLGRSDDRVNLRPSTSFP